MADNSDANGVNTRAIPYLGMFLQAHIPQFHNLTMTQIASHPDELSAIMGGSDAGALWLKSQYAAAFGASTPLSQLADVMANQVDHADNHLHNPVEFAIMTPFMVIFVALRLWSRKAVVGRIWYSDWLILLGAISTLLYEVVIMMGCFYGGSGKHMWDVKFEDFVLNLKVSYFVLCYYSLNILPIKLSLLFFYNTISQEKYYRLAVKGMVVIISVATVIFTFLLAFLCTPIGWFNNPANPNIKCMDKLAIMRAQGIFSFMTDIIILVLPVSVILKLKMGTVQKISVILLFVFGAIGAVTSIIRLFTLVNFVQHTDYTFVQGDTSFWTILEAQIGIICCSAPALKALVAKYTPHLFHQSRGASGNIKENVNKDSDKYVEDIEQGNISAPWNDNIIINREPIPSRNSRTHPRPIRPDEPRQSIRSGNLSLSDFTTVADSEEYEMKTASRLPSALFENESVRQSDESWAVAMAAERRVHDHV